MAVLYRAHYRPLLRLAVLLVNDASVAEEVVSAAFVAMHGSWRRLQDEDKALAYLQQDVVRRARARLAADATLPARWPGPVTAAPSAVTQADAFLVAALGALPPRQREALVLRYYMGWSDARIAGAMGIRSRSVSNHIECGMTRLRAVLERYEADLGQPGETWSRRPQ
jgi:RNA polymerase sigma factor (sigma-70 family)